MAGVWSYPCAEAWTALEISGTTTHPNIAAACAFWTDDRPGATAPMLGLKPQRDGTAQRWRRSTRYLWSTLRPNPGRHPTVCWNS